MTEDPDSRGNDSEFSANTEDADRKVDETSEVSESSDEVNVAPNVGVLRWWPAALILILVIALRSILYLVESPSLPLMLLGFLGSGAASALILVWWLFASRATTKEKMLVFGGYLLIAILVCLSLHRSIQGMPIALFVVPAGTAAFGLGLLLTSASPKARFPVAMLTTLLGFGVWSAVQVEGFDGKFNGDFLWRWEANSEENFLANLPDRVSAEGVESVEASVFETPQWPGFRGERRDGVVIGVKLSDDWDSTPPKELWRIPIGPAWSSFAVAGNRLFTQEQRGDKEAVICLDADTGAIIWEYEYESRFWEAIGGAGPRATPTLGSGGLYALGGTGVLSRLDPVTGELKWQRKLEEDAGRKPPTWGFAASPLIIDSLVVVHAGGSGDKGVLAYDIETGEPKWSAASGVHSYSSAQMGSFGESEGILMLTDNGVQFLEPSDGSTIWNYDWKQEDYRVVQPLVSGDSVLVGASLGTGARRISVVKSDNEWNVEEDWDSRALKPDFNDSVLYDGYVYGFDSGIFCCIDFATGERAWKRGRYGNGQVILLKDSGQLLVVSEKGDLVLVEATPEKLIEQAKFAAFDGKTWNHPVLIGNRLYVRNAQEAACFELSLAE